MRLMSFLALLFVASCAQHPTKASHDPSEPDWALALHGGAGTIPRTMDPAVAEEYRASLSRALAHGAERLAAGESCVDVVEAVVVMLEDDPRFNAGKGAVYTHEGTHELDACLMVGDGKGVGAVAGVRGVKNPIRLARQVMEASRHVMMMGAGAEEFARSQDVTFVEPSYFGTERRHAQWQKALEDDTFGFSQQKKGTVGCVALDRHGHVAAATSTGGLTNKRFGRVGDVPIVGAGTYADDATCAVSCTGYGEQFIRHTVAREVAARMEFEGRTVGDAADQVIHHTLNPGDGGLIAVSRSGEIAWSYNSDGMFRGAADASGRFDVAIWELEPVAKER